KLLAVLIEF
ncbi:nephrin, partial [Nephila pilipes]